MKNLNKSNKYIEILKNKKMLYAHWRAENKEDGPYHNYYLPLKEIFDNIVVFDPAKNYFNHGKKKMNEMLIELVKKEKPDYILFGLIYDEFYLETFKTIKQISPKTITINLFGDDDWRFWDFTRYYALFFDYYIITQDGYSLYKKDGIKNVSVFGTGVNCEYLKPLNLEKIYDISFYGRANQNRADYIKYLGDNKINIKVFGDGWAKYPELDKYNLGHLSTEDLVKLINQSKINLGLSAGGYGKLQLKAKPFEASACKSFALIEYFEGYLDFFNNNTEIIMFKDKKDLIKKINYYLKNEKEMNKIIENGYKRVYKDHNNKTKYLNLFKEILKKGPLPKNIPKSSERVLNIQKEEIFKGLENLKQKLKGRDYILISNNNSKISPYKEDLQIYSLEKSKKDISCCDYYIHSPHLSNYLLFKASLAFNKLDNLNFHKLIIPTQLMFKKDYFINNFDNIINFISKNNFNLITKDNTVFVSIPLLETNKVKVLNYNIMKDAFQMKFLDKLYSLHHEKRLIFNHYPYRLIIKSIIGQSFILKAIYATIKDSDKLNKALKGY